MVEDFVWSIGDCCALNKVEIPPAGRFSSSILAVNPILFDDFSASISNHETALDWNCRALTVLKMERHHSITWMLAPTWVKSNTPFMIAAAELRRLHRMTFFSRHAFKVMEVNKIALPTFPFNWRWSYMNIRHIAKAGYFGESKIMRQSCVWLFSYIVCLSTRIKNYETDSWDRQLLKIVTSWLRRTTRIKNYETDSWDRRPLKIVATWLRKNRTSTEVLRNGVSVNS